MLRKIDMVAMITNANSHTHMSPISPNMQIVCTGPGEITILVRHLPDYDLKAVNTLVDAARRAIRFKASQAGIENDITIKEDIKSFELKK